MATLFVSELSQVSVIAKMSSRLDVIISQIMAAFLFIDRAFQTAKESLGTLVLADSTVDG